MNVTLDLINQCINLSLDSDNLSNIFNQILIALSKKNKFDYAFVAKIKKSTDKGIFYRYHSFFGFDKLPKKSLILQYYKKNIEK